jgi:hypothetical protein
MSKRSVNKIIFIWILLIAILALVGRISIAAPNAGRTAADFLQVGIGARAAGLGGAYTALADGPEATWWNPAGLGGLDHSELRVGHFLWYQDITLNNGAVAFPLSRRVAMAASMTFVNYGKIAGYDQFGNETGNLAAHDWSGGLSVGAQLNEQISAGFTARYISQKLADVTADGLAADFGLSVRLNKFKLAAAATNIGPTMKFETQSERLPAALRFGVAFDPDHSTIAGAVEIEKKVFGDIVTHQGIELRFSDQYFLRTGLNLYPGQGEFRSIQAGYSVGAGIRLKGLVIDYAFTPSNSLASDDLHRFSLGFNF